MRVSTRWRGAVAAASAITMLTVPPAVGPAQAAPTAASAADMAQQLTDYINAGSPDGRRAVNGLATDADWTGPTRKLPPIPPTVGVGPRQRGFWPAFAYSQVHPRVAPPGANDWNCKPKAGQNPVVLLHGTWENAYDNWAAFAPALKKAGFCVFTPNYGRTDLLDVGGLGTVLPGANGVAKVSRSAEQIDPYITKVLAKTGAEKIDLIGHSQGGLLGRYWMKRWNGHRKVDEFISYGATNNGTTLLGIGALGRGINNIGIDVLAPVTLLVGSAGIDQTVDSPTVKYVNNRPPYRDPDQRRIYPDVDYTIVGSRYDEVTTPYDLTFIRGYRNVRNITLQDGCEADTSDHVSMSYSPRAVSIALRTLDPKRFDALTCAGNPWFFSF
ncbi:esterase/lipase family protein [Gordonia shandongensis]|uniref:esterase/lipase family protein n=1 Tax=Gordonia shandongensis TaxID=376351 RepID=UPI0006887171|nr:alpha/beta fold hydrolase [Gordonia shandongensis]